MNIQKLFEEIEVSLEVEEPECHFFRKGDCIEGTLYLRMAKISQIKNIEMRLQCTEKSVVLKTWEMHKSPQNNTKNFSHARNTESKVHWQSAQRFIADGENAITSTDRCQYTHRFCFTVPDEMDFIPGTSMLFTPDGRQFGITWKLQAVVHRIGFAPKRGVSKAITVLNDGPFIPKDQERSAFSGSRHVKAYRPTDLSGISRLRKWIIGRDRERVPISFKALYPAVVLPQSPLRPQLNLSLWCSCPGIIYLDNVRINLIQRCVAQARKQKAYYIRKYEIGVITEHRIIYEDVIDFTPKIYNWVLEKIFPPNFETNLLKCSYEIEVEVNFKHLTSIRRGKRGNLETLSSTIPVVLASLVDSTRVFGEAKKEKFVMAHARAKSPNGQPELNLPSHNEDCEYSSTRSVIQRNILDLSPVKSDYLFAVVVLSLAICIIF